MKSNKLQEHIILFNYAALPRSLTVMPKARAELLPTRICTGLEAPPDEDEDVWNKKLEWRKKNKRRVELRSKKSASRKNIRPLDRIFGACHFA